MRTTRRWLTATDVHAKGYSVWATPRLPKANGSSCEALLRYDHWTPNSSDAFAPPATAANPGATVLDDQKQNRTIIGALVLVSRTRATSARRS